MEKNIHQPLKGLHLDSDPIHVPDGYYTMALNMTSEVSEGGHMSLSTEEGTHNYAELPEGFRIIGDVYLTNNDVALLLVNPQTGRAHISIYNRHDEYQVFVDTSVLDFRITNQADVVYRLRKGDERTIYWVDGLSAYYFNFDRPYEFYNSTYQAYLDGGGNPNTYPGEKWDKNSFKLFKTYDLIPHIDNVKYLNYGDIKPGSYNFGIQLLDEDLNPTEVITITPPIKVFHGNLNDPYHEIRGSYSTHQYQQFPNSRKSINIEISNLDPSYPYYRVVIVQATEGTGSVTRVLVSNPTTSNNTSFTYSGNDWAYSEIPLQEVLAEKALINNPQHIEQSDNRLIIANTTGSKYDWCEFQKAASLIDSEVIYEKAVLNDENHPANIKNAMSFTLTGFMPGEVEAFGIVYLMEDNTLSPVFHIPGPSSSHTTNFVVHEAGFNYPKLFSCTSDYWGVDSEGNVLEGNPVRFHKFPLRSAVGKPLYTKTPLNTPVTYYKHRIYFTIELAAGQAYPAVPEIPYTMEYRKHSDVSNSYFDGTLLEIDLGKPINIADFVSNNAVEFDVIPSTTVYGELDTTSDLGTYMMPGSEVFVIIFNYEVTEQSVVYDTYESEIFGVRFSNIQRVDPRIKGFYIVRSEVFEEDKIVFDNGFVGPNVKAKDFIAFSHITPGFPSNKFDDESAWAFIPEVHFNNKELNIDGVFSQGTYETDVIYTPTKAVYNTNDKGENISFQLRGILIEDVQAGTTYNPEVHKKREKDSDGFSLHAIYKQTLFSFDETNAPTLPELDDKFILNAASSKAISSEIFYNASTDNKISMLTFKTPIVGAGVFKGNLNTHDISWYTTPMPMLTTGLRSVVLDDSRLVYATFKKGSYSSGTWSDYNLSYQDFLTRTYYRQHVNPIYFNNNSVINNVELFSGDAYISGMTFTTSMFRRFYFKSRRAKIPTWKYIVGGILIAASIVLAVIGVGAPAAVGLGALAAGLLSAGMYFVNSGIQLDKAIQMFEQDYEKGLLEAIEDEFTIGYGGPAQDNNNGLDMLELGDDTIQWTIDIARDIFIESRVPFGLRSGTSTRDVTDFLDAPAAGTGNNEDIIYNYISEKLTYFDRESSSGRLYRGVANSEVYSVNPDYTRPFKEKLHNLLPLNYDCCSSVEDREKYPMRYWVSQQSFQEEHTDNYRTFLPNNYRDLDGETGEITDIYKIGPSIYLRTEEGVWQIPQNLQERANTDLITFIGTGEFFAIPPRKILDGELSSGGSSYKWATQRTKHGVVSFSELEGRVYLHSEGFKDLTNKNVRNWFKENSKFFLNETIHKRTGKDFLNKNNPANPAGTGCIGIYDPRHERYILTKKDYKLLTQIDFLIENKVTEDPYPLVPGINILRDVLAYDTVLGRFVRGVEYFDNGIKRAFYSFITDFSLAPDLFENVSYTISYSFLTDSWVSFHSYLPLYYFNTQNTFYSSTASKEVWKHNFPNIFNYVYKKNEQSIIEVLLKSKDLNTRIWEDILINTTARYFDTLKNEWHDVKNKTFNKALFYNSEQCSGVLSLTQQNSVSDSNWLQSFIDDEVNNISISRREEDWNINGFRNYRVNNNGSMFISRWQNILSDYWIDKVVDTNQINYQKNWIDADRFRDKYLVIRLIFDSDTNTRLSLNYLVDNTNISYR